MPLNHCMIDIETWGTRPGAAIRSIGAVAFDLESTMLGSTFYVNVDPAAQIMGFGLKMDPATALWWSQQGEAAREVLEADQQPLPDALRRLEEWWAANRLEFVWSHGAAFDVPLIDAAAAAVHRPVPCGYRASRDTRTLFLAAGEDGSSIEFAGVEHNALDDAVHQARRVQAAWSALKSR